MLTNGFLIQESITVDYSTSKFWTTNLNFSIMLGEDIDENTNIMWSSFYIPKSLRDKDCFDKSTNVYNVNYIFLHKNSWKNTLEFYILLNHLIICLMKYLKD